MDTQRALFSLVLVAGIGCGAAQDSDGGALRHEDDAARGLPPFRLEAGLPAAHPEAGDSQGPGFQSHERVVDDAGMPAAFADAAADAASDAASDAAWDAGEMREECPWQHQQDAAGISLRGLLYQMIDLEQLARLPRVWYQSRLSSSYNRVSDGASPGEPNWYAGHDNSAVRMGEPLVLLDVAGPGAVTRIWSANPAGTLRIYIDDSRQPVLEADMRELLSGEVPPFSYPYGFIAAHGHNLYFPFPFQKRCRITTTVDGETSPMYYQVNYRAYEQDASVEPFSELGLEASECELQFVAERLTYMNENTPSLARGEKLGFGLSTRAEAESEYVLKATDGGSIIRELRLWSSTTAPEALRETLLSLSFDGRETVSVPLGDFFGSGPGIQHVNSLPVASHPDGRFVSRWPMLFGERANIKLVAVGHEPIDVDIELTHGPYQWTELSLLFHGQWKSPQWMQTVPPHDWNMANIRGKGFYIGNVLNIVNTAHDWWGEGDEKISVDGEGFPSHFGTGTEDYYGYAWCSNETFTEKYVGQPRSTRRQNFGRASLYRWHVLDAIPFQSSIEFDLEISHWGSDPVDMAYDTVSFWYARPGSEATVMGDRSAHIPDVPASEPMHIAEGPYNCGGL